MSSQKLRRSIMLRVYYRFTERLVWHPTTIKLMAFAAALLLFARLVFVSAVVKNFLSVTPANMPAYLWHTVINAEFLVLMSIGVMLFVGLSLPRDLITWRQPRRARIV